MPKGVVLGQFLRAFLYVLLIMSKEVVKTFLKTLELSLINEYLYVRHATDIMRANFTLLT